RVPDPHRQEAGERGGSEEEGEGQEMSGRLMSSKVMINLVAQIKMFFRSPGSVFWTVAFPVLLILLFGAIFSGTGNTKYSLYVQDLDGSPISEEFVQALNKTG